MNLIGDSRKVDLKVISFSIDRETVDKFKALSKKLRVTQASIITKAMKHAISQMEEEIEHEKQ